MRGTRLVPVLIAGLLLTAAEAQAQIQGFQGPYDPAQWTVAPIAGGTSEVDPASDVDNGIFTYDVNLGGGGVTQRTAIFSVVAEADGTTSFDWDYSWFHAWFQAEADLIVFAVDAADVRRDLVVLSNESGGGNQSRSGNVSAMQVWAGKAFGIEVGGSNFDSNSRLTGTVTLTNFEAPGSGPVEDCNGVPDGPATLDNCGVCDADPTNDCEQDCAGTWGGNAVQDMCGVCDEDPSNDCAQDCAGEWGGDAVEDLCGECDDNPDNDCVEDCAGVPGGTAEPDNCGVCDDDHTNNCTQDCFGTWGGDAITDDCGVCAGGETGIPLNDCDLPDETGCDCGLGSRAPAGPAVLLFFAAVMLGPIRRRSI